MYCNGGRPLSGDDTPKIVKLNWGGTWPLILSAKPSVNVYYNVSQLECCTNYVEVVVSRVH